jgi:hypothetical protein
LTISPGVVRGYWKNAANAEKVNPQSERNRSEIDSLDVGAGKLIEINCQLRYQMVWRASVPMLHR